MTMQRSCWACNMRRLACDRDGAECSRCVKYGFLCAWPAGRATGGRVVVRTREAYLKLAEGRGSTPLRLEKTACAKCRASRRACDGARPVCGRCEAQSFECIYPPQGKRRPKSDDSSPPSSAAEEALPPAVAAVKPDAELPSPVFPYFPAHDPELALAVVNPLAVVPTGDYLALPSNIDEATVNKFTNAYFESVFLKTMVVVLHPQSFFGSLRGAPTVDRTLLAAITWYGALVADADRSISKPFQRRAWRSLLEMRAAFWGQENPPLTLGSAYMASLVIMLYAAWRTVGMGAARRFQEELVRAGWHLGIPFWGTAPTPNLSTKSWIEKQICLYCWWYEGVSSDATLGLATGSDLLLDPRQWATLEMPVEMGNFLSIDANQPLPDYILSLDKLRAETILGWTWLEAGSDARLQILQHLQDPIGIRTNCGVCWSSVLAMLSGQILSDIAILRKWLDENNLGQVYELAVEPAEASNPLRAVALARRQHILSCLADCRLLFPRDVAAAIEAGDGYGLIESAMDLSFVPRIIVVFGVAVGLESIAMQLVAPPPFVTPSPSWFASPDFVAATAHAITITRLINSSSRHPGQNFFQLSTVPYLVLQASWIHVLTIRSMIENAASNPTEGNDPIANSSMFVDLIEDTNICLEFVRMNATEGWSAMMQSFELLRRSLSGDHVAAEFSKLAEVPTEQGLAEVMEQGVVVGEAASGEPEECGGYRAMA